jgi:hypothetical protein
MQVVLRVKHRGEAKIVAKVFPANGKLIALHETTSGPDQWHYKLDSPGGVDYAAVAWMAQASVSEYHHIDGKRERMFTVSLEELQRHGIRESAGGRDRIFLPVSFWNEVMEFSGKPPYKVPWIPENRTVVLEDSSEQAVQPEERKTKSKKTVKPKLADQLSFFE